MVLKIALVLVVMIVLAAFELWLFWSLGERAACQPRRERARLRPAKAPAQGRARSAQAAGSYVEGTEAATSPSRLGPARCKERRQREVGAYLTGVLLANADLVNSHRKLRNQERD
ncbi:MAG TPA: hypothetical protein VGL78_08750 [Solirubrobacteraceae bacterium]|jgi:hypothetical protein